jgi:deoxyribodipyrimidine photo-lyase
MNKSAGAEAPILVWFRRDLRLADNPALFAAAQTGRPLALVYVLDETPGIRAAGAAGLWWLDKSLPRLGDDIAARGGRLILRRGVAADIVGALAAEIGAAAVYWNRLFAPDADARDAALAADLQKAGVEARQFNAGLLVRPEAIRTKAGGPYSVFTPYWRTARADVRVGPIHPAPQALPQPKARPGSDRLADWKLHPTKPNWSGGFGIWTPGEAGAHAQLEAFVDDALAGYPTQRDLPATEGTSRLSPHLHWGEIGPRQVWSSLDHALHRDDATDAVVEKFRAELGWREFNHHILAAHPRLATESFRPAYDAFPWRTDAKGLDAWKRGRTGYPLVDAGMRQLWQTGWMHNRVRMVVGSFLVKHLLIDWREGERWFWDTLVDACEANNPANWQWVAGSGADAQPFFRIFNPASQAERYDPSQAYIRRWVPEFGSPRYPRPIVEHAEARARALATLKALPRDEGAA